MKQELSSKNNKKSILYIWSKYPSDGYGLDIVAKRHLNRLSNSGWKITVVIPEADEELIDIHKNWNLIIIPRRRWWWIPFRDWIPYSELIRIIYWIIEVRLKNPKPDLILTIIPTLNLLHSSFIRIYSKIFNIPLAILLYDQAESFSYNKNNKTIIFQNVKSILDHARGIWSVSEELVLNYKLKSNNKVSTIYPIPEGNFYNSEKKINDNLEHFNLVYSGYLYDSQIKILDNIAEVLSKTEGTLTIINNDIAKLKRTNLSSHDNIVFKDYFKENSKLMEFMSENAAATIIIYPNVNIAPWFKTSFPSKLVEYSYLEIPIILIADPNTELGRWAKKVNWEPYLQYFDRNDFNNVISDLKIPEKWKQYSNTPKKFSNTKFNADSIQKKFEVELSDLIQY